MTPSLPQARDFVYRRGTDLEKARIDAILEKKKPSDEIIKSIEEIQNQDGGFPYMRQKGMPSTLNNTEGELVVLNDLGLLSSEIAKKALGYIMKTQKEDGSWDENSEIMQYDPPPWMVAGERRSIVYHTAYCAFWLGVVGLRESDSFIRGHDFLKGCQDASGKILGFLHSSWIGTSVFAIKEGWASPRVRRGLDYLVGVGEWVASQISWMLWCFGCAGAPRDTDFVETMLSRLQGMQRTDGGFPSEDGEEFEVGATIEAVKVALIYGASLTKSFAM